MSLGRDSLCVNGIHVVGVIDRWAVLNIAGGYGRGGGYSDEDVMRAAGYLEGVLTQPYVSKELRVNYSF